MNDIELVRLSCNSCGADLDAGATTRFVTCAHCGAKLEVKRSGNAAFTDVVEKLQKDTERIADDVRALRKQSELEALDRDWAAQRDALLPRDKQGNTVSGNPGVVGGFIAAIFGVFWMFFAHNVVRAPLPFTMFGLVFIVTALYGAWHSHQRAGELERARREYERRRAEIERG